MFETDFDQLIVRISKLGLRAIVPFGNVFNYMKFQSKWLSHTVNAKKKEKKKHKNVKKQIIFQ